MSVSEPGKIITPWAESGLRNPIPAAANPETGRAGFDQGFSAINMTAKEAGGIPPFGQDFNGIFYDVTNIIRYMQAGGQPTFSYALATAIGGYPKGAMVLGDDGVAIYTNRVDGNSSNPNSGGSGWVREDLILREALRRSYAEAGYNLAVGSFETGGTVTTAIEPLLYEAEGNAYTYSGALPHTVPVGSSPSAEPGMWVDRSSSLLRGSLASSQAGMGASLVYGVATQFDSMAQALASTSLVVGRKIEVGGYNINSDGGQATFEVVNSTDPIGILTDDGNFKIKRMSGHDYFQRAVRSGVGPKVIAHRGWSGITQGEYQGGLSSPVYFVPENTRAAIRFAAERGAWGVEGDTKITSDGVPVIFHDSTTDRVCGVSGTIEGRTLAQVKALDAGSYVSSMYSDEKILTYPEWLNECRRAGVVAVAEWSAPMTLVQAQGFLDSVYKYFGPQPSNVILMSTYPATLEMVRSLDAFICLVVMPGYGLAPTTTQLDSAYKLGNCGLMLTGNSITDSASVSAIKARGIPLLYAIANAPNRIDNAISAGADVIITDCYRG